MPGNPFLANLSESEKLELQRLRPYINRLYNEATNKVNYYELFQRLKNKSMPLLAPERVVIRDMQRNFAREQYFKKVSTDMNYVALRTPTYNSAYSTKWTSTRTSPTTDVSARPSADAFKNWELLPVVRHFEGDRMINKFSVAPPSIVFDTSNGGYWPEDFSLYKVRTRYDFSRDGKWGTPNNFRDNSSPRAFSIRPHTGSEFQADRRPLRIMDDPAIDEKIFDDYVKELDEAPKKAQEAEEARQRAERERRQRDLESQISLLNSRYETSLVDHQKELENQHRLFEQMRAEDSAKFQKELEALRLRSTEEIASERLKRIKMGHIARELELARDESEKRRLAYETMSEQRLSELRKDLLSRQEEQAKRDAETALRLKELKEGMDQDRIARETERARLAEEHKMELANLQGKLSVAAQTLEAERAEKARMKKQSELFMRNVLRRRNMRNAGSLNLHFLGEGQPDSPYRSNELLFIGDNRYVPSMTQLNTMGRAIRTDTAVPDIFQSMLRQNRPNQQRRR